MDETPFLPSWSLGSHSADSQIDFCKCDECKDRDRALQEDLEGVQTPNWWPRKSPHKRWYLNCMLNNRYSKEMS